jgi:hypothetical protein
MVSVARPWFRTPLASAALAFMLIVLAAPAFARQAPPDDAPATLPASPAAPPKPDTSCSLVTTGLMPSLLKQDPRCYQGRAQGFGHRLACSASRSLVTRSRTTDRPEFNLSEVGGTLVVANISNLYYPTEERAVGDTLMRWGTQAMWDTVANELKEFWPDIRKKLKSQ